MLNGLNVWLPAILLLLSLFLVVLALAVIRQIKTVYVLKIAYTIQPGTQSEQALTVGSNSLFIDLGTIASGSTEHKKLGKITTLYLPGSRIGLRFNKKTADDFEEFSVMVWVFKAGETSILQRVDYEGVGTSQPDSGLNLPKADNYDIHLIVSYTAKNVTTTTSGEVEIKILSPLVVKFP